MKKRVVLKPYVLPTVFVVASILILAGIYVIGDISISEGQDIKYVSDEIIEHTIPVIETEPLILSPFIGEDVALSRGFYDYSATTEEQEKSLVGYDGTYMQNSGVDYTSSNVFPIVSVLDGTVIEILDTELFGKKISIKHNNNIISSYQGVSDIKVSVDDNVLQGQEIAVSGTSVINKDLGNHLHFELYNNGNIINPITAIGKKVSEINK